MAGPGGHPGGRNDDALGVSEALEFLHAAANDPGVLPDEFAGIVSTMWNTGTLPTGLAHIYSLTDAEFLREHLQGLRGNFTSGPARTEAKSPPTVEVADSDDDEESEDDEDYDEEAQDDACPICGSEPCPKHCLASFDRCYDGQGLLGAGLSGGALYDLDEVGALLDAIREAKVAAWPHGGLTTEAPTWIATHTALKSYFAALGDDSFDLATFRDGEEARAFIAAHTDSHGERVRALLEAMLSDCGWDGTETTVDDDGSMAPTSWILWWDEDVPAVTAALAKRCDEILADRDRLA